MSIQSFKKHIFLRFINCILLLSFLCAGFPVKSYADRNTFDNLRPSSLMQKDGGTGSVVKDLVEAGLLKDKGMKEISGLFDLAIKGSKEKGGVEAYNKLKDMALKSPEVLINYYETLLPSIVSNLPKDLFGGNFGYDIRGNALVPPKGDVDLTPNNCYLIGKALGKLYAKEGDATLTTGDQRWHTPILRLALVLGYISVGVNADFSDEILGTGEHGLLSGENPYNHKIMIQVSGSHGETWKNGIKIKVNKGEKNEIRLEPLYAVGLADVYTQIKENKLDFGVPQKLGKLREINGLVDLVVDNLNKTLPEINPEQPLLFDCRNSALIDVLKKVVEIRGLKNVRWFNDTPDPSNPGGIWNPSKSEALVFAKQELDKWNLELNSQKSKYRAVAFVFDGDGDRAVAILEDGTVVPAFEMTLPFYQRFISDPVNKDVIKQLRKAGYTEKIWLVCDIRATSALISMIDTYADYAGYYIQPGYPPQRDFVRWRIAELNKFVESKSALTKNKDFMRDFGHFKNTYFTAEASGHQFFHICPNYPDKVIDAGIAVVFNLLYIKETISANEAKDDVLKLKLPQKKDSFELVDLFKAFPETISSDEVRIVIPHSLKAIIEQKVAKKLKEKYKEELVITKVGIRKVDDMIIQPKEDGAIEVEGIKAQLKSGGSAMLKKSNTAEEAVLIFEGSTLKELNQLMLDMEEVIKASVKELLDDSSGDTNIAKAVQNVDISKLPLGRIQMQEKYLAKGLGVDIKVLRSFSESKQRIHKEAGGIAFDSFVETLLKVQKKNNEKLELTVDAQPSPDPIRRDGIDIVMEIGDGKGNTVIEKTLFEIESDALNKNLTISMFNQHISHIFENIDFSSAEESEQVKNIIREAYVSGRINSQVYLAAAALPDIIKKEVGQEALNAKEPVALMIDTQFFNKLGAVQGVQKLNELLGGRFKIGLYGKSAERYKMLLGGRTDIVVTDNENEMMKEFQGAGVKIGHIVALNSSAWKGYIEATQLVFSKDGLAIVDLAMAAEKMLPAGKGAFEKFFTDLNANKIIAEKSYDPPIHEIKQPIYALEGQFKMTIQVDIQLPAIMPTEAVAAKIEEDAKKASAFITDTFI